MKKQGNGYAGVVFFIEERQETTPFNSLNSLVCQVLRIKIIVEGNEFREIEIL